MNRLGIIDQSRLKNIPPKSQPQHEFCFHLHDLMTSLLVQMEIQKAGQVTLESLTDKDRRLLESGLHILDFLNESGRGDLERRAVINHLCVALYADMLYFIYEGLRALEKRKFAVAFTLFRKPLKEGMLFAAQMCADEERFFDRMKLDAKNLLIRQRLNKAGVKSLLGSALKVCRHTSLLSAERIYDTVFDRQNPAGLAVLFDKATHLVTEFSAIQTENYNVNFIFKNPADNDVYENGTYRELATLLFFLNLLQIELYSRMGKPTKKYEDWLTFTSVGAFESLFVAGRSRMANFVNRHFGEFLECPVCQAKLRLKKSDAPRFFVAETLDCNHCLVSHHFPVRWLLSRTNAGPFDT